VVGSVFIGFSIAFVLGYLSGWPQALLWARVDDAQMAKMLWIFVPTLLLVVVSFIDDRFGVAPGMRFMIHGVAASCVVLGAGMAITVVPIPLVGPWMLGPAAALVSIVFIMWIINLYNFMDGLDAFAGGMTLIGFGCLSGIAWLGGHNAIAMIALFIAAAAAGFLPYNSPPAKIFLGDVGSIPLGFLAGALAVIGIAEGLFDVWVPILIFSPFIMDATATLFRRLFQGEKIWLPHREHYYQRLILSGWGRKKTILAEYVLMCACGCSAILYEFLGDGAQLILLCAWVMLYAGLMVWVRMVEREVSRKVSNQ